MQLMTKHFGLIEYDESDVVTFEYGIPGFIGAYRFLLLKDENDLFSWLQCVDEGSLAFVLVDVFQVMIGYDPVIDPQFLEDLGDMEHNQIYNIAVIPEDVRDMRVNLKAPIVINHITCKGKQVIVNNEEYGVRHYIFEDLEDEELLEENPPYGDKIGR